MPAPAPSCRRRRCRRCTGPSSGPARGRRFLRSGRPSPAPASRPAAGRARRAAGAAGRSPGRRRPAGSARRRRTSSPPSAACGRSARTARSTPAATPPGWRWRRTGQAALRGGQLKIVRQQRHQRLHAVQEGEGGETAEDHGAVDAPEFRAACGDGSVRHAGYLSVNRPGMSIRLINYGYSASSSEPAKFSSSTNSCFIGAAPAMSRRMSLLR
jgi:hypothetical protein